MKIPHFVILAQVCNKDIITLSLIVKLALAEITNLSWKLKLNQLNYFAGNTPLPKLGLSHGHFRKYSEQLYGGKLRTAASDYVYM